MCLYSKEKVPLIAEKDIVCYKILRRERYGYFSPYQEDKIIFNKTIIASRSKRKFEINKEHLRTEFFSISEGFIHAYNMPIIAYFSYQQMLSNFSNTHFNIVKCIIPKGSRYFNGIGDDICADRMIITDERIV